jgi:hypothetical protein
MMKRELHYSTRHLTASQRPPSEPLSPVRAAPPGPAAVLENLRAQAVALGIPVNRRWTPARLRLEIAKHFK